MEKLFPLDYLRGQPGPICIRTSLQDSLLIDCDYVYAGTDSKIMIPRMLLVLTNGNWEPYPIITLFKNSACIRSSYSIAAVIIPGPDQTLLFKSSAAGLPPDFRLFKAAKEAGLLVNETQI